MSNITCGLFIISEGKLLTVHPTGHSNLIWSIPKGLCDEKDNDHLETAIRETEEETNLKISTDFGYFIDLGFIKYKKRNKILHGFMFVSHKDLTNEELKCTSMVMHAFPEVDRFNWVEPTKENISLLHETQQDLFKGAIF